MPVRRPTSVLLAEKARRGGRARRRTPTGRSARPRAGHPGRQAPRRSPGRRAARWKALGAPSAPARPGGGGGGTARGALPSIQSRAGWNQSMTIEPTMTAGRKPPTTTPARNRGAASSVSTRRACRERRRTWNPRIAAAVAHAAVTMVITRITLSIPWTPRPRFSPGGLLRNSSTASRVSSERSPAIWSKEVSTTKTEPAMTSQAAMVTWAGRGVASGMPPLSRPAEMPGRTGLARACPAGTHASPLMLQRGSVSFTGYPVKLPRQPPAPARPRPCRPSPSRRRAPLRRSAAWTAGRRSRTG
jgi:hypothetical protein